MRYDVENQIAALFAAYLVSEVDADMQEDSPIVTFYDPMSVDEENRIVVQVPSGQTRRESMANGLVAVDVGIKSQWHQKTIKDDFKGHFDLVAEVRDKLFADCDAIVAAIIAAAAAQNPPIVGIEIDYIDQQRAFKTEVLDGWLYTETSLQASYYNKADN